MGQEGKCTEWCALPLPHPSHPAGIGVVQWSLQPAQLCPALSQQLLGVTHRGRGEQRSPARVCSRIFLQIFYLRFWSTLLLELCKKSVIELSWPELCLQGFFTLQTAYLVGGYLTMNKAGGTILAKILT